MSVRKDAKRYITRLGAIFLAVIGIGLLGVPTMNLGPAVAAPASSSESSELNLRLKSGLLFGVVRDVPLSAVLQRIAELGEFRLVLKGDLSEHVSWIFRDEQTVQGVGRLVDRFGSMTLKYRQNGREEEPTIIELHVYGTQGTGVVAIEVPVNKGGQKDVPDRFDENSQVESKRHLSRLAHESDVALVGEKATMSVLEIGAANRKVLDVEAGSRRNRTAIDALVSALKEPNVQIRAQAVNELASFPDQAAHASVFDVLGDDTAAVRPREVDKWVVSILNEILVSDPSPLVRRQAVIGLQRFDGEGVRAKLLLATTDESEDVRKAALSALKRY